MIALTAGDPCGIGAEIIVKTISDLPLAIRKRLMVICDQALILDVAKKAGGNLEGVQFDDRGQLTAADVTLGQPSLAGGHAQVAYLERAAHLANRGAIAAIVTAPINKACARRAGFQFPGHTEFFSERLTAKRVGMLFVGPTLRIILATIHHPISHVTKQITEESVRTAIELGSGAMRQYFGIKTPIIGVLALNPHAGEEGLLGSEEIEIITPAIAKARESTLANIIGPLVPDAAYRTQLRGHSPDLFVAMYHDQALIPIKLIDFEKTVNVTVGLPVIRTSPDHGTAYDIAGNGVARHQSFAAALNLAIDMLDQKERDTQP